MDSDQTSQYFWLFKSLTILDFTMFTRQEKLSHSDLPMVDVDPKQSYGTHIWA